MEKKKMAIGIDELLRRMKRFKRKGDSRFVDEKVKIIQQLKREGILRRDVPIETEFENEGFEFFDKYNSPKELLNFLQNYCLGEESPYKLMEDYKIIPSDLAKEGTGFPDLPGWHAVYVKYKDNSKK